MVIAKSSLLDCKYFCSGDETGFARLLGNKMKTIRFGRFSVSERRFIFNYCCVCFSDGLRPQLCSTQCSYKKNQGVVMPSPSLRGRIWWGNGADGGCKTLKWGKDKCREQGGNSSLVRGAGGFGGKQLQSRGGES